MKTVKLYDADSHQKEFTATVLHCEPRGDGCALILDRTAFFPEGGGQESDRGTVGEAVISAVFEENGTIIHEADRPLPVGRTVCGRIDWPRRFRNMQHHSGEHILSGLAHRLYGCENIGFHLSSSEMTLDFDRPLSPEQLQTLETLANEAVFQNTAFHTFFKNQEELTGLNYRSKKELTGPVRLVEIEGVDLCACCAPHVCFAGEIGLIKILNSVKNRGGVRLFVKCGTDALADYRDKCRNISAISALLAVKPQETAEAVVRLQEKTAACKLSLSAVKKQLLEAKAAAFLPKDGLSLIVEEELDRRELLHYADLLHKTYGGVRAVFSPADGAYAFTVCGEPEQTEQFFAAFRAAFSVRGGGRNGVIQGTVTADRQALLAFAESINK